MTDLWPWLALAGLGFFHGINPAMGWLFAVALGLHRRNERTVYVALLPIALGHALAIAVAVAVVLALGAVLDLTTLRRIAGVALIAWAIWHWVYGHRHRVRVGMRTGMLGLFLWSFLMASAHGAGLMLIPALLPLHAIHAHAHGFDAASIPVAIAAVALHTLAMLAATTLCAAIVYRRLGVAVLKSHWINFDLLWTAMLIVAGALLLW